MTKTRSKGRKAPVKMVKLANGGKRPETAADRDNERRWAKAERDADAAKAFDLASKMEDVTRTLANAVAAVRVVAMADEMPDMHAKALYGLADMLDAAATDAEAKREQIAHLTWAYRFPEVVA